MKGDHIYTLNHNIKSLEQKHDEHDECIIKVSSDYIVREDTEQSIYHKMIDNVDDILKIIKETEQTEKQLIYLVLRNDNLTGLYYELRSVGYDTAIKYETGRITHLIMEFSKITFIIRTQQLITSVIQYPVVVDNEETYNLMNTAMVDFNKKLFKASHKSYYTQEDINILDEYRTIANTGMLSKKPKDDLVEIDVSKAYTSAFCKIKKIPIFTEFDNFVKYSGQKIENYSLYIVESKSSNLFFSKRFNLCYGMFLKKVINPDYTILYFKKPSSIKKVDYQSIVDELWKSKISDDEYIDTYIKKLIGNINFGLLEKSQNKRQRSFVFDDLSELKHYQSEYGGRINIISKILRGIYI
jgi:hypothetical protein